MLKTYKYRINPDKEQIKLFENSFGCARFVYNYFLELKKETYINGKNKLSKYDMDLKLKTLKEEYPWLKEVNSQLLQAVTANLDSAFSNFFKYKKSFPKFKRKKNNRPSFCNPQHCSVDFHSKTISIPKAKNIKAILHRNFNGKIKSITITKSATDKYYASILVETEDNLPVKTKIIKDRAIGIDLGLKHFIVTSNGNKINNPRFLKQTERKIKIKQKKISRMKKTSKNRQKQIKKIAKLHEKILNQRQDFLHKISSTLINENQIDVICIEDLNVKGMVKNRTLSKSISDTGWGMFEKFLRYKSEWNGKWIIDIGRFDPSSKTCSCCGYVNKTLSLDERSWKCVCGTNHDRDINAAINIKEMAFNQQNLMRFIGLGQPESKPVEKLDRTKSKSDSVKQEALIG